MGRERFYDWIGIIVLCIEVNRICEVQVDVDKH